MKMVSKIMDEVLSWSKRLECVAKQDPGRARQGQAEQLSKSRKIILATT